MISYSRLTYILGQAINFPNPRFQVSIEGMITPSDKSQSFLQPQENVNHLSVHSECHRVCQYMCAHLCLTLCDPMDYIACQATLSMGFPRQEYWSGFPFPSPGDLPDAGIKPASFGSPVCRWILYHRATWEVPEFDNIYFLISPKGGVVMLSYFSREIGPIEDT